jgi:hypothetical protein
MSARRRGHVPPTGGRPLPLRRQLRGVREPAYLDGCSIRSNAKGRHCRVHGVDGPLGAASGSRTRPMFSLTGILQRWTISGRPREPRSPRSVPEAFSRIELLQGMVARVARAILAVLGMRELPA